MRRSRNWTPRYVRWVAMPLVLTLCSLVAKPIVALPVASDESAEHDQTCADLFAAPPFDDRLTRNGGRDIAQLRSRFQGSDLIDVFCSREAIIEYVGPAGWTLNRELLGLRKTPDYRLDEFYEFCIPRRWFGVIPDPCQSWAQFYLLEGRIKDVKVSGGL